MRTAMRPRRYFMGSLDRKYSGPLKIDERVVGRVEFREAYERSFGAPARRTAIVTAAGARGRKRALDGRRPLQGCEHEFSYHEDVIGDYGVVNGTYTERWLECDHCGAERSASCRNIPCYDELEW